MQILIKLICFFVPMGADILSFPLGGFQVSPFRICILIALIAYILRCLSIQKIFIRKDYCEYIIWFHLIWFVCAICSVLWSKSLGNWVKAVYFLFVGVVTILLFQQELTNLRKIISAMNAFVLGILFQCAIGWYEIITKDYRFLEMTEKNIRYYVNSSDRIPVAMQNNPNNFAILMYVGVVLALFIWINTEKTQERIFAFFSGINCALLLVATTSRANLLGLILMVIMYLLLTRKNRFTILLVLLGFPFAVVGISYLADSILNFSFKDVNGSESIRLNLIFTGLHYVIETFGRGVGAGQVEVWIEQCGTPYSVGKYTNLHNWWIEILACYGIIIFVGYLGYYWSLLKVFWNNVKNSANKTELYSGYLLISSMIGYVIACISPSSMVSIEWNWCFWAIIVAYARVMELKHSIARRQRVKDEYFNRHTLSK